MITPDPQTLLDNLIAFLYAANPHFEKYMPKWSDDSVHLMPEGSTYDDPWFGPIIHIPSVHLGVAGSQGRCRLDASYRPAGTRPLYDSNGNLVMSRATPRQIDMIATVEHDPALTVSGLEAVFTAFIATHPLADYEVPQELQDQGAPATLSLHTDSSGNCLVTPPNPWFVY